MHLFLKKTFFIEKTFKEKKFTIEILFNRNRNYAA